MIAVTLLTDDWVEDGLYVDAEEALDLAAQLEAHAARLRAQGAFDAARNVADDVEHLAQRLLALLTDPPA